MMTEELKQKYKGFELAKTDAQQYFYDEFLQWVYENCNVCNGDHMIHIMEDGDTFENWFKDYHYDLWKAEDEWWDERIKNRKVAV